MCAKNKQKKDTATILQDNTYIDFHMPDKHIDNMLMFGNLYGFFGHYKQYSTHEDTLKPNPSRTDFKIYRQRIVSLYKLLESGTHIEIVCDKPTEKYFRDFLVFLNPRHKYTSSNQVTFKEINTEDDYYTKLNEISANMKFDYIIQNPPYNKTTYIKFLNIGLDLLSDTGQMVAICPSTWLVDVRTSGKNRKMYDELKARLENIIETVTIEKLSKQFNISIHTCLSIIYVNKNKKDNKIQFSNCGLLSEQTSLDNCNLIGDYKLIQSILNKVISSGISPMSEHITRDDIEDSNIKYLRYAEIYSSSEKASNTDIMSVGDKKYFATIVSPMIHQSDQKIYDNVPENMFHKKACCVYGTKTELNNWKHFVFNNALGKFINACLIIDASHTTLNVLPWLTDKKYTDDEINKLFGFTDEEIALIEYTLKKFEWTSKWFQRMFTGDTNIEINQTVPWL